MQRHAVHARLDQLPDSLLELPFGGDAHARSGRPVARVEQHPLAGLRVLHVDPPCVRELAFPRIVDRDRDDVVAGGELRERVLPAFRPEIGEGHHDGAVAQQLRGVA